MLLSCRVFDTCVPEHVFAVALPLPAAVAAAGYVDSDFFLHDEAFEPCPASHYLYGLAFGECDA